MINIKKYAKELEKLNAQLIKNLIIQYTPCSDAPNNWKTLSKYTHKDTIPVYSGASKTAIYSEAGNIAFRAVHDYFHLLLRADFSQSGERRAIMQHARELKELGCSPQALKVFLHDTWSQVKYYYKHKQFINNQSAFITYSLITGNKCTDYTNK